MTTMAPETKAAARDIFTGNDVIATGKTPHTALEIHLGANVLAPVFRAQQGFQLRLGLFRCRLGRAGGLRREPLREPPTLSGRAARPLGSCRQGCRARSPDQLRRGGSGRC